jgi:hypothetical protein
MKDVLSVLRNPLCSARTLSAVQWFCILVLSGFAIVWGVEAAGLIVGVLRGVAP